MHILASGTSLSDYPDIYEKEYCRGAPSERIIELAARLQFNRQMGEASGQTLNLR